jgi:hypothetical protein
MLGKYQKGDILSVAVTDGKMSLVQIVRKLRGNVLLAVFPELLDANGALDAASLELDEPIFLVETMDLRIKDGSWPVVGNREVAEHIPVPEYKVWVEPPGEYRIQDIHGNVGVPVSGEQASGMKLQKSFSPAVVEAALRGFHGVGPWRKEFDELTL